MDRPKPSGQRGPEISISSSPSHGRPASVLRSDGSLHRGYLFESGMIRGDSDVIVAGPEIRFRVVNSAGRVVIDGSGKQIYGPAGMARLEPGAKFEVRYVTTAGNRELTW